MAISHLQLLEITQKIFVYHFVFVLCLLCLRFCDGNEELQQPFAYNGFGGVPSVNQLPDPTIDGNPSDASRNVLLRPNVPGPEGPAPLGVIMAKYQPTTRPLNIVTEAPGDDQEETSGNSPAAAFPGADEVLQDILMNSGLFGAGQTANSNDKAAARADATSAPIVQQTQTTAAVTNQRRSVRNDLGKFLNCEQGGMKAGLVKAPFAANLLPAARKTKLKGAFQNKFSKSELNITPAPLMMNQETATVSAEDENNEIEEPRTKYPMPCQADIELAKKLSKFFGPGLKPMLQLLGKMQQQSLLKAGVSTQTETNATSSTNVSTTTTTPSTGQEIKQITSTESAKTSRTRVASNKRPRLRFGKLHGSPSSALGADNVASATCVPVIGAPSIPRMRGMNSRDKLGLRFNFVEAAKGEPDNQVNTNDVLMFGPHHSYEERIRDKEGGASDDYELSGEEDSSSKGRRLLPPINSGYTMRPLTAVAADDNAALFEFPGFGMKVQ